MIRDHRPHGPAPLARALSFEEVAQHRNLRCGLYAICLEVVVRRGWASFTCQPCSLWHRARPLPAASGPAQVLELPTRGRLRARAGV